MWMWLLLLSWCAMSMPTVGQAAMGAGSNGASDEALGTTVISQRMTFKNQQSQAVFDGAVVLTRGTLVVYSDRMVVSFRNQEAGVDPKKGNESAKIAATPAKGPETVSNRAVSLIEATGRVKIERDAGNRSEER